MKRVLISHFSQKAKDLLREGDNKGYAYLKAIETLSNFVSISRKDIIEGKIIGKYLGCSIQSQMREIAISTTFEKPKGSKPFNLNPHKHYTDRNEVLEKIKDLLQLLRNYDFEICGSFRRGCQYVGDIDILIFEKFPNLSSLNCEIISKGDKLMKLKFKDLEVDMRSVKPEERGTALVFYTGPKNFNIWLRSEVKKQGYKLNEYCLSDGINEFKFKTEQDLFKFIGINFISPEEREIWR